MILQLFVLFLFFALPAWAFQGFGENTTGGDGLTTFVVSSCADSGANTLRDAVSTGSRYIRFSANCTGANKIVLATLLDVNVGSITIDGLNSPANYIEFSKKALRFRNSNAIYQGLRCTQNDSDCFQHSLGATNIVGWRSVASFSDDENASIGGGAGTLIRDMTLDQMFIYEPALPAHDTNFLIQGGTAPTNGDCARRVTITRSIFASANRRNPWVDCNSTPPDPPALDTVADLVNNLLWEVGNNFASAGDGMAFFRGTKANSVGNFFKPFDGLDTQGKQNMNIVCDTEVTGLHTGGTNSASLTDSTKNFTNLGVQVGWSIWNIADNSAGCTIATVGATTLTCSPGLSGGTDNDFDTNDTYRVVRYNEHFHFCKSRGDASAVYTADNVHSDSSLTARINDKGTTTSRQAAPTVDAVDGCTAAWNAVRDAGVKPRNTTETTFITAAISGLNSSKCWPARRFANPGG